MQAVDAIREYRNNKEKYLPLIDHEKEHFQSRSYCGDDLGYTVNIGWNCGFIGHRPYFYECWATEGITMLTVFLSTIGIEDASVQDLEKLLIEEGKIYTPIEGYSSPALAPKFTDGNGNEFYSINICVGIEDEPPVIDGAPLYWFSTLNQLNGHE